MKRVSARTAGFGVGALAIGGALLVATLLATSGGAQSQDGCDEGRPWPFESISCRVYQSGTGRLQLADVDPESIPVSADQAAESARREYAGAQVLETKLVYAWSSEGSFERDRELLWAASLDLPGEPYVSGYAFTAKALATVRPGGDWHSLTAAEEREVNRIGEELFLQRRSQITETYHIAFIDPQTGEWLGAAEGGG